jgi:hypothetical protein
MGFLVIYTFSFIVFLLTVLYYLQTDHYADYNKQPIIVYQVDIPTTKFIVYDRQGILDRYDFQVPRLQYTANLINDNKVSCYVRDVFDIEKGSTEKIVSVIPLEKIMIFIGTQTNIPFNKIIGQKILYVEEDVYTKLGSYLKPLKALDIKLYQANTSINTLLEDGIVLCYDYVDILKTKMEDVATPVTIFESEGYEIPFAKLKSYDMSLITRLYVTQFPVQTCYAFDVFLTVKKERESIYKKELETIIFALDSLDKNNNYTRIFGDTRFSYTTLAILRRLNKKYIIRDNLPILEQ